MNEVNGEYWLSGLHWNWKIVGPNPTRLSADLVFHGLPDDFRANLYKTLINIEWVRLTHQHWSKVVPGAMSQEIKKCWVWSKKLFVLAEKSDLKKSHGNIHWFTKGGSLILVAAIKYAIFDLKVSGFVETARALSF